MTSLALAAVVHVSIAMVAAEKPEAYAQAHRVAQETGKPMMVMVSATWCAPCQQMKKTVLPECKRRGLLNRVAFAIVDVERQRKLARKLTGGGPIPQLVMYRKTAKGWKRRKLVGGQSVASIEKFIKEGTAGVTQEKGHPGAKSASLTGDRPKVKPVSRR